MKSRIMLLVLVLVPMLLAAGIFDGRNTFEMDAGLLYGRAWRMTQQLTSYKYGAEWVPSLRVIPFYNPTYPARVDSMHMDSWDEDMDEWILSSMIAYFEYNAAGRMVSNVINMNYMGMLIPMMKETAVYDAQNRITNLYMYYANIFRSREWVPVYRMHMIHTGGTTFEIYGWEEGGEESRIAQYFHSTFEYDGQGRITEEYSFTSPDSTNWVHDYRDTYDYHAQDTSTGADFIEYASSNLAMMMMNDGFGFPGLITNTVSYLWDGSGWQYDYRSSYQYDALLHRTVQLDEYYMNGNWQTDYNKMFYYDANGQPSYTIGQMYDGMQLVDDERIDYTWEHYGSANDDQVVPGPQLTLRAYPSPFMDELKIETSSAVKSPVDVSICNLRGQLVRAYQSNAGSPIIWDGKLSDGSIAPAGIYLVKVTQDRMTASQKVLRLK
jgi:hypothetical protein